MLNTEIREYVSQMNQEELKEVEQVIIESKVRQAIREFATEQQLKCIETKRNFVINQMERGDGKSWGIALEALYNMKNCNVKSRSNKGVIFLIENIKLVINAINENIGDEVIKIEKTVNREDSTSFIKVKIGSKNFEISEHTIKNKIYDTLYCDDYIPFSTKEHYNKVVAYVSEKDIRKLMNQCYFNDFMNSNNSCKKDLYIEPNHE